MLNVAKKIAMKSNHRTHKHATLILKGGALLSVGYNYNEHHAEAQAIYNVPYNTSRLTIKIKHLLDNPIAKKVKGSSVINIMLTKTGRFGKSRPCLDCWRLLLKYKVSKVTYFDGIEWKTERVR